MDRAWLKIRSGSDFEKTKNGAIRDLFVWYVFFA